MTSRAVGVLTVVIVCSELNTAFSMILARTLPKVRCVKAEATPVGGGGGAWKVTIVLQNQGWMSTYVTEQAKTTRAERSDIPVKLTLAAGLELVSGKAYQTIPHLLGRERSGA